MSSLVFLLCMASTARAVEPRSVLVPWTELGLAPAALDAMARGPELLHAAAGGRLALYDAVDREVVLLEGERVVLGFPVRHASDLVLLEGAVIVLDHAARQVASWSLDGDLRAVRSLPDLTPTSLGLVLEGDQLHGQDIFGNRHPVATVSGADLSAPQAQGLLPETGAVFWDGQAMSTGDFRIQLPHAIKASGQRFGDWLVLDVVVADDPIQVERSAWHVPSRQSVALPVEGRLYAPRGDVAATPEGELVVMVPWEEGLELRWVSP